jgi:hypothetical protein
MGKLETTDHAETSPRDDQREFERLAGMPPNPRLAGEQLARKPLHERRRHRDTSDDSRT